MVARRRSPEPQPQCSLAGVVLFAEPSARVRLDAGHATAREVPAVRTLAPVAASTPNVSASRALATPCASPRVLPVRNTAPPRRIDAQRAEALTAINAPSHPAPVRPLTAQERALVELARTADPKMLAALVARDTGQGRSAGRGKLQQVLCPAACAAAARGYHVPNQYRMKTESHRKRENRYESRPWIFCRNDGRGIGRIVRVGTVNPGRRRSLRQSMH